MIGNHGKTLRGFNLSKEEAVRLGRRLRREYLGWPWFEIEEMTQG
jgi:hypothetical protein